MKSKKLKFTSVFLVTSLLMTPISNLVSNSDNIIKANTNQSTIAENQKDNIYKILEPNVSIENGIIELKNKQYIKNKIVNDWENIKLETEYKTPEELFTHLDTYFTDLNYKSKNKIINIKPNGEIIETSKRKKREVWPEHVGRSFSDPNYHVQNHWWGSLHFFYTDSAAYRYAYEVNKAANVMTGIGATTYWMPILLIPFAPQVGYLYQVSNTVNYNASLPGNGVELALKNWGEINCKPR